MYLGIEIGGTKLQLAVGHGDRPALLGHERIAIEPERGAQGILEQLQRAAERLLARHQVERIGIGFGGPVDAAAGRVIKSHQIAGWEDVPLSDWCEKTLGLPTRIGNDCNVAALAEARFGAGRNRRIVFYVTVGSGVGGGLVVDGQPFGLDRPAVAEIGHMRPGLGCQLPDATVESLASGWGMAKHAQQWMRGAADVPADRPVVDKPAEDLRQFIADKHSAGDLLARCGGNPQRLTAELIGQAAAEGNPVARHVLAQATRALGWAIAQVITLVAPDVVVIGGGVSNLGAALFLDPVQSEVRQYVFPPLADSYKIVPAALGELVVVHGAVALAAQTSVKEGGTFK